MATSRDPSCPSLPPELWIRILSYHTDLTHLWATCRAVSPAFRAYVEQVFAEYVLRDTYIDWQLEKYNLGGRSRRPEVPVSFSRFSGEGKKVVYFRDKREKSEIVVGRGSGAGFDKVMERWEDRVRTSKAEMPHYTIRIGDMVNDSALPGLRFGRENREIGFDWRGMFQLFFREQERMRVLKRKWHQDYAKQLASSRECNAPHTLLVPWSIAELDARKQIRRARLKEWYKDDEEMVWAIDSLKYFERSRDDDRKRREALPVLDVIPGAGVGERWFGSMYWVEAMALDESDCLHRIDTKVHHLKLTEYDDAGSS